MKILKSLMAGASSVIAAVTATPAEVKEALVEKRNGTYVSRAVLNADVWQAWMERHGVPSPTPDLHVTVCYSTVDVKVPCDNTPITVATKGWQGGAFVLMGPDDDFLVFAFDSYQLQERNWAYQAAGAISSWPTYRPHMTLTSDFGDYELPDEALSDVPDYIVLGPETVEPLQGDPAPDDQDEGIENGDDGDDLLVVVIELSAPVREAAAKAMTEPEATMFDRIALRDMAKTGKVTKSVLKSIAKRRWSPPEIREAAKTSGVAIQRKFKTVEKEVVVTMGSIPEAVRKNLPSNLQELETDEEEHLVWGWASVAKIGGQDVVDLQGDTITTGAQRQWLAGVLKMQASGDFEHEGEAVNTVVEGIVLDSHVQKMLGIDLGMEGCLTCTHVPGVDDWAKVKEGSWMHSIAGTALVLVEE